MDQVVESFAGQQQFMGSVLVARGNDVLFNKAYGSADLEWNIPNTTDTKFRIGSVTKQFTAACILLLEERGKLSVNDLVKKYMPDAPAAWDKVTIYNVLTHTAGIPNFTNLPDYAKSMALPATPEQLVARFRDLPLDFQPGEKWSYSNSGYVLLGNLIEKISGETYQKFVTDNIFTPLGMKDSGYDSNLPVIAHRASGYGRTPQGFQNAQFIDMTVPFSAGALYSTTGDLLKWEQGLFGGKLLKPESLTKMTMPFLNNYAFGLGVSTVGGRKMIDHNGGVNGFSAQLAYYPDDKLTVAVLSNMGSPAVGPIATQLAAIAHGEKITLQTDRKETTVDPKVLARYVGAYRLAQGADMVVTVDGTQLNSKLGSQPVVPLYPQSETMFFAKVVDAQVEFAKMDARGVPGELILHQNGRDMPAPRLSDAEAKQLTDAVAATAKRVKDQTPDPRGEAALRRMIEQTRTGQIDYSQLGAGLAAAVRQQAPMLESSAKQFGALVELKFTGVGPGGMDIYNVKFENGSLEYRIALGPDGKIEGLNARPVQ